MTAPSRQAIIHWQADEGAEAAIFKQLECVGFAVELVDVKPAFLWDYLMGQIHRDPSQGLSHNNRAKVVKTTYSVPVRPKGAPLPSVQITTATQQTKKEELVKQEHFTGNETTIERFSFMKQEPISQQEPMSHEFLFPKRESTVAVEPSIKKEPIIKQEPGTDETPFGFRSGSGSTFHFQ